jgi:hypothetical protein
MASSHRLAGQTPRLRPLLLVFLSLLFAMPLSNVLIAQTTTSGGLTGVVTDQSSAVVADAKVEIKDDSKGTNQSTKTDYEGVYRFFFLAPGKYTIAVAREGFRQESRVVNVLLGPPVSVNVTLRIAKVSSEITVTDEAPIIQAENGDTSSTMNQKQISELPNPGNDLTYVAQTAPGVVMNTDIVQSGFNFSILGMPGTSYLYTIDGMNNNDNGLNVSLSGASGLALGQNQIQEATVVSTGYSGQFGGAAGGNINYITKSGSNEFHGNAQSYWNGRVFNANDWFNNALRVARPFDNANQWTGSFGGPIKRNRLFFFFDTEGLRLLLPQPSLVSIPSLQFEAAAVANIDSRFGASSASDAFYKQIFSLYNSAPGASPVFFGGVSPTDPTGCSTFTGPSGLGTTVPCARYFLSTRSRPSSHTLVSGRLDWNVGKNDRTFLRLQRDDSLGAFAVDPISPLFDGDVTVSRWQGQFLEVHTFGASAASQFLLAGSYLVPIFRSKNFSEALSAFPTFLNFSAPGTFANLGGANWIGAYGRYNTQYQISEDVMITHGKQKFGIGANFAPIHWSVLPNKTNAVGSLSPQTLDAFYQGGLDPATPSVNFTSLTQSFTTQTTVPISYFNLAVYGEDEWHARPDLNLTFAVRAEHYSNPACERRCYARPTRPFEAISHDPQQPYNQVILINQRHAVDHMDAILWSPRLSFAWQPFGVSHNGVLRGGVGFFYDSLPGGVWESFYINSPIYNIYTPSADNLTPNETTSLFKDAAASNAAFVSGFAAGQNLSQIQNIDPNFSPPAVNASQRTLHSPQFQRWSLEWQQAFGTETSVSLGYFGHHGIHELWQSLSTNAFGFGSFPSGLCASPPVQPCADPRFAQVTEYATNAVSSYHGMVLSVKHQFTHWTPGIFQANYTYGHALDEVSNGGIFSFTSVGLANPQDPNNLRGAYGPAEYDVRHSFNASYVLELPLKRALGGHGPDRLTSGWQISGTIFARTGFPYTVVDVAESTHLAAKNNYFGTIYSVPVRPLPPGTPCGEGAAFPLAPHPCQPAQSLVSADGTTMPNPNALFVQSSCETGFNRGTLPGPAGPCSGPAVTIAQGRNRFRGPSYFNTDFAITKNTKIPGWENAVLGIGFQFFNFFNHPNFGMPDRSISDPTLGNIFYLAQPPTSVVGSGLGGDAAPRMIQLKAQFQF